MPRWEDNFEEITIGLERSRDSRAFLKEESLWRDEIIRIRQLLKAHIDSLKKMKNFHKGSQVDENIALLSVAILGSYGSGKSSLLRTFVSTVREESNLGNEHKDFGLPNVKTMDVLEPNRLHGGSSFLYVFLAQCLNMVEKQIPAASRTRNKFRDLSNYLRVIDQSSIRENDPLEQSLNNLERHLSDFKLREELKGFINEFVVEYTGSTDGLVLMPIDDADMSFNSLMDTLETLRLYLRHERLVPIVTFTGRLAEEMLQLHFEEQLTHGGKINRGTALMEASTGLNINQNLALQYLSKLFPVRNRIKIGIASGRVQVAKFKGNSHDDHHEKMVLDLLKLASHLMFGFSDNPFTPVVRSPLMSASLRRQIQIVDAMFAADILKFPEMTKPEEEEKPKPDWYRTFDTATWSLMNIHRDVLKEYKLNLEDLYSWTPKGLRHVILTTLLDLNPKARQKLIQQWESKTGERRGLLLSLLAAYAFRPSVIYCQLSGDDPYMVRFFANQIWKKKKAGDGEDKKKIEEAEFKARVAKVESFQNTFSTRVGLLWFINLWIGFYLPLILSRYCNNLKINGKREGADHRGAAAGIGWDLIHGPVHAVRQMLIIDRTFCSGMVRIDYEQIVKTLERWKPNKSEADETKLVKLVLETMFLHIWCFFGFDKGEPWAAVSMWRGLCLMGQLLEVVIIVDNDRGSEFSDEKPGDKALVEKTKKEKKERIKKILENHFWQSRVQGTPEKFAEMFTEHRLNKTIHDTFFAKWPSFNSFLKMGGQPPLLKETYDKVFESMVDGLYIWLEKSTDPSVKRINPMKPAEMTNKEIYEKCDTPATEGLEEKARELCLEDFMKVKKLRKRPFNKREDLEDEIEGLSWRSCFIRRIHGDELMNHFWKDLETLHFDKKLNEWNAFDHLCDCGEVYYHYWECGEKYKFRQIDGGWEIAGEKRARINAVIDACPIMIPFLTEGRDGSPTEKGKISDKNGSVKRKSSAKTVSALKGKPRKPPSNLGPPGTEKLPFTLGEIEAIKDFFQSLKLIRSNGVKENNGNAPEEKTL